MREETYYKAGQKSHEKRRKRERERESDCIIFVSFSRRLSRTASRDGDSNDEVNAERRLRGARRKKTETRKEGLLARGPEFKRTTGVVAAATAATKGAQGGAEDGGGREGARESAREGEEEEESSSSANANIRSDRD